ncbi:MAG TPA: NAD(P)H-dependent glycerol-3-phosphate dehydrogenase [Paracoccaceae bacterium]|nr:NAD(P)H-dependent glycerol-3-phosphate dehydrogenase [Paracoccaceae bacterium]
MSRIAILGQGAWGTALGASLAGAGADIAFWRRGDDAAALGRADLVISAVPAQATREVLGRLASAIPAAAPLILTAKGLERGSLLRQSQVAAEIAPGHEIAVLSGPSFAADLTRGLPTAVTLATEAPCADRLQQRLATPSLRPYLSDDLIGVEIGGALKNVIAIACGAAIGAGFGESARAALMARGFAELSRLAIALGARVETLGGLSGLGDLALTCTSAQSRNFRYGVSLGEIGRAPEEGTYEGAQTADAAMALARQLGVSAPITETVAALVGGRLDVRAAVEQLYNRPLRRE